MQIQSTSNLYSPIPAKAENVAPATNSDSPEMAIPTETVDLRGSVASLFPSKGYYSPGKIALRAAGGAIVGGIARGYTDGSVGSAVKLGAYFNGVAGATEGALEGGRLGSIGGGVLSKTSGGTPVSRATGAVIGGIIGAGAVGVPMAAVGAVKGALISVIGNALGGGALAYAGSGAVLGAIGL